jgi:hypothetical protein
MKVVIGQREFEMGSRYVTELRSSNDILQDDAALRQRMQEDGYLLIRGFHNRDDVMEARKEFLLKLQGIGRLTADSDPAEGIIGPDNKGAMFHGFNHDMPALLNVVNSPSTMNFFDRFLDGKSLTYDYKWARAVPRNDFTGAHYDIVYMGRGTKRVYTLWTPIGDISYEMGGLAICLGSQHYDQIKQTYGQMDVDRDHVTGWFSTDPLEIVDKFGGRWATTEFQAGDAILFGMYMMHGSLTNTTDRYRISVDTRYQLATEPVDERWWGKKPKGHYAWLQGETVSMEDARKKWGV